MSFALHSGPFLPGVACGCAFLYRLCDMRDADSRLTLHADLYHMKRRDQLLPARSVRGVPLQGGGMETSGRQPYHFLHRRAEIAILKKCDVFIDKPAVFVYLHLRVGM